MLRPTRAPFRAAGSELMQRTARDLVAAVLAVVLRIFVHDQIHLLCSDSMYGFAASYTVQNSGSGTGQQPKRPVLAKKQTGRSGKDFYKILLTNRRVMI